MSFPLSVYTRAHTWSIHCDFYYQRYLSHHQPPSVHTRAAAWCSSPAVSIISTSSCCCLGRDMKAPTDTVNETQMSHLQKTLPSNFMLKCFSQWIKNVVLPNLFCLITKLCQDGTRLISVTALRERGAVSRLISSGHKVAALVFLAGGLTLWTLRDRSRGGEYWPCLSWDSLQHS